MRVLKITGLNKVSLIEYSFRSHLKARELALRMKALAPTCANLRLIPRSHRTEPVPTSHFLTFIHVLWNT